MIMETENLIAKIQRGEFVVSVQVDPPLTVEAEEFIRFAEWLKKIGISVIDINSSRRISHDSITVAMRFADMGFETIPHVTTRDSSMNGLVNQMLGAISWKGVRNFLVIGGDPYEVEQAIIPTPGVFQTRAAGAIRACDMHLRKKFQLEDKIFFAASVNQNEPDLEFERMRLLAKRAAGADFFMSQPVFDQAQADLLFGLYHRSVPAPLLVGIWPLLHWRTIEMIREGKVVGVALPDEVYNEAAARRDNKEGLQKWALEHAFDMIRLVKKSKKAQGVYIVAPRRDPFVLEGLLKKIL